VISMQDKAVTPSQRIAAIHSGLDRVYGIKQHPLAVSVTVAARLTGLSRSTLYAEMAAGRLAYAKVGKRRLIPTEALLDWLNAATTEVQ
jgi:excisionase family DNA binding protein